MSWLDCARCDRGVAGRITIIATRGRKRVPRFRRRAAEGGRSRRTTDRSLCRRRDDPAPAQGCADAMRDNAVRCMLCTIVDFYKNTLA
jgi:hypothetical protein